MFENLASAKSKKKCKPTKIEALKVHRIFASKEIQSAKNTKSKKNRFTVPTLKQKKFVDYFDKWIVSIQFH